MRVLRTATSRAPSSSARALPGIDLSTCEIAGLVLSSDFHELRGCIIDPEQAVDLVGMLGVKIKE